uniref:Homeobox domain-containing protein n=1 Tax=Macrostomum lignano TaxID=282301 RepID=A0A1I8F3P7_9PLAT
LLWSCQPKAPRSISFSDGQESRKTAELKPRRWQKKRLPLYYEMEKQLAAKFYLTTRQSNTDNSSRVSDLELRLYSSHSRDSFASREIGTGED